MSNASPLLLLSAPIGQLSLLCEQRGCFHEQGFELSLSWTASSFQFRSSATDALPTREAFMALLKRLVEAMVLPESKPQCTSTTIYDCSLSWSATTKARDDVQGQQRWISRSLPPEQTRSILALIAMEKWPARLEFPPEPAHQLFSIARAPLEPEAPPQRFVAAILDFEASDEQAAVRALRGLFWKMDIPFTGSPRVLAEGEGRKRLQMQCEVAKLLSAPAAESLEGEPALRAMEQAIREALAGVAELRSLRYREVP